MRFDKEDWKANRKHYVACIGITVALYFASSVFGSFAHALIALISGYSSYAEYSAYAVSDMALGPIALIFLTGAGVHILFPWITVRRIARYMNRHGRLNGSIFTCASASVVVFALLVMPILQGNTPGWITYLLHSGAIVFFGKKTLSAGTVSSAAAACDPGSPLPVEPENGTRSPGSPGFCRKCGTELSEGSSFCHKCGTKIL